MSGEWDGGVQCGLAAPQELVHRLLHRSGCVLIFGDELSSAEPNVSFEQLSCRLIAPDDRTQSINQQNGRVTNFKGIKSRFRCA